MHSEPPVKYRRSSGRRRKLGSTQTILQVRSSVQARFMERWDAKGFGPTERTHWCKCLVLLKMVSAQIFKETDFW